MNRIRSSLWLEKECKKLDLFGGELVGMDGSKFKAVNSKKKNFNEAKLKKRLTEIEEKIDGYPRAKTYDF